MNLDHLRVFYTAANKKNFSETAKILHLSQPSVSLQIKNLEESLHTKLFDRTTKKMELTDSGKILFMYVGLIFEIVDKAKKELTTLSTFVHGDLFIGASLTIGEHLLPYALGEFKKDFPHINLIMKIYNSKQINTKLIDEEMDLGFIEAPMFEPSLKYIPFLEDELVIITTGNLDGPISKDKDTITPSELFSLPIILREEGSGTRQVMENTFKSIDLDPSNLNVVLELENTESIKATVESGMGISILSKSAIQKELQLGTLRLIKLQGIILRRNFYIVHKKDKVLPLQSEAFLNFIMKKYLP
ncbi:MAG: LysR family transcriptional regulator [Bacillaceae bacterium]|nr:LysR family transcriptional regulator [Bacillaceae bacterium]